MENTEEIREEYGRKRHNTTESFRNLFPISRQKTSPKITFKGKGSNSRVLFVYHNDLEEGFVHPALAVLGGMMVQNGIEAKLFDTSFWRDINSPLVENDRQALERLGEYKKVEGYNPQREVVNIGERFREEVEKFRPDLIALTSTSYEFNNATSFILPTKREFGIPVIVGGPHATVAPDRAIQNPAIDIVCVGDGEKSLYELVKRINMGEDVSNIPSLWFKDQDGKVTKNPRGGQIEHMDDLPIPNWDMFDPRHRVRPFEGKLKSYGYFEISRGCPFKCSYCIQPALHEIPNEEGEGHATNYKFHSAREIVNRVKAYKEKYGFNHIQLIDENLPTMNRENLEEIATLWSEEVNSNKDITIFTMSRPEYLVRRTKDGGFVSSGKVEILKEMGVAMIALGAESGNEWLRANVLNRPMKQGILEAASKVLMDNKVQVSIYNILGFPFETREMMLDTIDQLWRIKPDRYAVRHLSPYPGTPIRDLCVTSGFIHPSYEDLPDVGTKSFLHTPILNLPKRLHKSKIISRDKLTGEYGIIEHPSNSEFITHPSKEEQITIRKLFGVYAYSPTKAMWPIIELAENRSLAKGYSELQNMVYQSFATARANRSEDDDAHRPELNTNAITYEDVPWAGEDANLYVGRPKALLPVIELAAGRGYAQKISGLQEYVRNAFVEDIKERKKFGIKNLSETRARWEEQKGRMGFMAVS